jgi:hypothetical protein
MGSSKGENEKLSGREELDLLEVLAPKSQWDVGRLSLRFDVYVRIFVR